MLWTIGSIVLDLTSAVAIYGWGWYNGRSKRCNFHYTQGYNDATLGITPDTENL